jgi:hypothetical protein
VAKVLSNVLRIGMSNMIALSVKDTERKLRQVRKKGVSEVKFTRTEVNYLSCFKRAELIEHISPEFWDVFSEVISVDNL